MQTVRTITVIAVALSFLTAAVASAQSMKESLFAEAEEVIAQAKAARADVLAPKNYGKATEHFREAEKRFERGKDIQGIRSELEKCVSYLRKAIEATELAKVTFPSAIKARDDAVKAASPKNSAALWSKGEKKFSEAARDLEDGDVNDARKKSSEAESLFRDAELDAIKNYMFNEARAAIQRAVDSEAEEHAPKTLARAKKLLSEAESSLANNRYDTDQPRVKTMEAEYEALHAVHIARLARDVDRKALTVEEIVLASEAPIAKIGSSLNVVPAFDKGYEATTKAVMDTIGAVHAHVDRLGNEVADRDQQIHELEAHVELIEKKLGGASEEQAMLQERLRQQEEARKRVAQIEASFEPGEARVVREGGDLIIRLVGMNFPSGQATIGPEYFGLLTRVQDAIRTYGPCEIRIEGNTDSYGTDEGNLELSQRRAEAVQKYLQANLGDSSGISAVGYGETRPIANNETEEGRAKNRRIDVVISPLTP